jgi:hypothetical protein
VSGSLCVTMTTTRFLFADPSIQPSIHLSIHPTVHGPTVHPSIEYFTERTISRVRHKSFHPRFDQPRTVTRSRPTPPEVGSSHHWPMAEQNQWTPWSSYAEQNKETAKQTIKGTEGQKHLGNVTLRLRIGRTSGKTAMSRCVDEKRKGIGNVLPVEGVRRCC